MRSSDPHYYRVVPEAMGADDEVLWIVVDTFGEVVEPGVGYPTRAQAIDRIQDMILEELG